METRLLFWKVLTFQNLHRIMETIEESDGRIGVAILPHLKECCFFVFYVLVRL